MNKFSSMCFYLLHNAEAYSYMNPNEREYVISAHKQASKRAWISGIPTEDYRNVEAILKMVQERMENERNNRRNA